jgi:hypothetical protein
VTCEAKRHGTYSAYRNYSCVCNDARRAYNRRRKQLTAGIAEPLAIDPTGTRRRLHALIALGWPTAIIFAEAGMPKNSRIGRYPTVHIETAAKIKAVYERLSMTPGPSPRSRMLARKAGYLPPLAWDDDTIDDPNAQPMAEQPVEVDEVAVRRALFGDRPEMMRRAEILEAIRLGHQQGLDDVTLGERLGMATNAVQQIRKRNGMRRAS